MINEQISNAVKKFQNKMTNDPFFMFGKNKPILPDTQDKPADMPINDATAENTEHCVQSE